MKKLIKAIACASFILPSVASAGTAIIPTFKVWQGAVSCYQVSNISNVSASVTVKFYGKNGESYFGPLVPTSDITTLETPFELKAHQTVNFCLDKSSHNYGYGVIESSSVGPGQSFLVAVGQYNSKHTEYTMVEHSIPINNGMPF
ncbi:hypothetical protein [Photobacterium kasasachensis]|uniref:hypothetical protein n=1 Tax=Photobacterium kasasachensis TaxID=2910240 RepID=UPI003D0B8218